MGRRGNCDRGKAKEFEPSKWAVVEKSKRYVKFTVTVVNKSDKPIDIGRTYISVQSRNKEEDQLFDSDERSQGGSRHESVEGSASGSSTLDLASPIRRMSPWKSPSMTTSSGRVSATPPRAGPPRAGRTRTATRDMSFGPERFVT